MPDLGSVSRQIQAFFFLAADRRGVRRLEIIIGTTGGSSGVDCAASCDSLTLKWSFEADEIVDDDELHDVSGEMRFSAEAVQPREEAV